MKQLALIWDSMKPAIKAAIAAVGTLLAVAAFFAFIVMAPYSLYAIPVAVAFGLAFLFWLEHFE